MVTPNRTLLAPSILAGNHARLADSLAYAENTPGIEWLHLDIMDGHFVPNITFGPQTVADLRKGSELFFDVHLMLDQPHRYIDAFIDAGADNVTVHAEPDYLVEDTLSLIRQSGTGAGICINPGTPVEALQPYLGNVDLVLLMTVQPGFGGQSFREEVMPKIRQVARWREEIGAGFRIEVDGGVNLNTGVTCRQAGADILVAGSAFFKATDPAAFVAEITGTQ